MNSLPDIIKSEIKNIEPFTYSNFNKINIKIKNIKHCYTLINNNISNKKIYKLKTFINKKIKHKKTYTLEELTDIGFYLLTDINNELKKLNQSSRLNLDKSRDYLDSTYKKIIELYKNKEDKVKKIKPYEKRYNSELLKIYNYDLNSKKYFEQQLIIKNLERLNIEIKHNIDIINEQLIEHLGNYKYLEFIEDLLAISIHYSERANKKLELLLDMSLFQLKSARIISYQQNILEKISELSPNIYQEISRAENLLIKGTELIKKRMMEYNQNNNNYSWELENNIDLIKELNSDRQEYITESQLEEVQEHEPF